MSEYLGNIRCSRRQLFHFSVKLNLDISCELSSGLGRRLLAILVLDCRLLSGINKTYVDVTMSIVDAEQSFALMSKSSEIRKKKKKKKKKKNII